jgi:O-acetyl-ADP-ribose deacetylase (regulator of RNase III)
VGPVWGEWDEDAKLSSAVTGSLLLADELKLASLALPAISTGVFGFPKERAAGIILGAVESFFVRNPHSGLQHIRIVLLDRPTLDAFLKAWPK